MRRRQKKWISIVIIFMLGILPLTAVGYFSHWLASGTAAEEYARKLSGDSGLDVTLGKITVDDLDNISVQKIAIRQPDCRINRLSINFSGGLRYNEIGLVTIDGIEAHCDTTQDIKTLFDGLRSLFLKRKSRQKTKKIVDRIILKNSRIFLGNGDGALVLDKISGEIGPKNEAGVRRISVTVEEINGRECKIELFGTMPGSASKSQTDIAISTEELDRTELTKLMQFLEIKTPASLDISRGGFTYRGTATIRNGEIALSSEITASRAIIRRGQTTFTAERIVLRADDTLISEGTYASPLATGHSAYIRSHASEVTFSGTKITHETSEKKYGLAFDGKFAIKAQFDERGQRKYFDIGTPVPIKNISAQLSEQPEKGQPTPKPTKLILPETEISMHLYGVRRKGFMNIKTKFDDNEEISCSALIDIPAKKLAKITVSGKEVTTRLLFVYLPNIELVFNRIGNPFPVSGSIEITPEKGSWDKWLCKADIKSSKNYVLVCDNECVVISSGDGCFSMKGDIIFGNSGYAFKDFNISIKNLFRATFSGNLNENYNSETEETTISIPTLKAENAEIHSENINKFFPDGILGWRLAKGEKIRADLVEIKSLILAGSETGAARPLESISIKNANWKKIRLENTTASTTSKRLPISHHLLWAQSESGRLIRGSIRFDSLDKKTFTGEASADDIVYGLADGGKRTLTGHQFRLDFNLSTHSQEDDMGDRHLTLAEIGSVTLSSENIASGKKVLSLSCAGKISALSTSPVFNLGGKITGLKLKAFQEMVSSGLVRTENNQQVTFGEDALCEGAWSLTGRAAELPPVELTLSSSGLNMKVKNWLEIKGAKAESRKFKADIFQKIKPFNAWAKQFKK